MRQKIDDEQLTDILRELYFIQRTLVCIQLDPVQYNKMGNCVAEVAEVLMQARPDPIVEHKTDSKPERGHDLFDEAMEGAIRGYQGSEAEEMDASTYYAPYLDLD